MPTKVIDKEHGAVMYKRTEAEKEFRELRESTEDLVAGYEELKAVNTDLQAKYLLLEEMINSLISNQ